MSEVSVFCPSCEKDFEANHKVRLWDGKDYCFQCVTDSDAGLAEYARDHRVLEDVTSFNWRESLRYLLLTDAIIILLVFCAGFVFGGVSAIVGLTAVFLLLIVLVPVQTLFFVNYSSQASSSISAQSGVITVRKGALNAPREFRLPLEKCRWYLGKVRHDSYSKSMLMGGDPVVILVYPLLSPFGFEVSVKIACGRTEEMRQIWIAFLRLAGVPERKRSRHWGWKAGDEEIAADQSKRRGN